MELKPFANLITCLCHVTFIVHLQKSPQNMSATTRALSQ